VKYVWFNYEHPKKWVIPSFLSKHDLLQMFASRVIPPQIFSPVLVHELLWI
jgi:hypothetical protein